MSVNDVHVVKLGGSLLDYEKLVEGVQRFVREQGGDKVVIVVGGARSADAVRMIDRNYGLDEERAHWLAVRGMSLNAYLVAEVLGEGAELVSDERGCEAVWAEGKIAVVEPIGWLEVDEDRGCGVKHCWQFTSDSIAGHIAKRLGARCLTLLKSTMPVPAPACAEDAANQGLVDGMFAIASEGVGCVRIVNMRSDALECVEIAGQSAAVSV